MMATNANSRAAYVHIYSLIAASMLKQITKTITKDLETDYFCRTDLPRMIANIDAKRPKVNAKGAEMMIA